jgi:hypothetical protein
MDMNKDYYAILGLTPSADAVVIRAAYRALAQRYHPDAVVAERLEGEFLSLYFGTNPMILAFARSLIRDGRRDAARDLNQAIRVIGASSDPEKVIAVIQEKYRIQSTEMDVPIPNGGVSAWELIFAVLLILAVGVGLIATIPSH